MNDIDQLADLALANIPDTHYWQSGRLLEWLNWLDASGCVIAAYDKGQAVGFAVVRPITEVSKHKQRYHINPRGKTLYCDLAVAPSRKIMQAIGYAVLDRFGDRTFFASSKDEQLHVHDFSSVKRALLKH